MNIPWSNMDGRHIIFYGIMIYLLSFSFGYCWQGASLHSQGRQEYGTAHELIRKELNIPTAWFKKIVLNNLGLNALIILGSFSMLAFSMMILFFNALSIGMLVKSICAAYGWKLSLALVAPHLVVEVFSQMLALYLSYQILDKLIVPVILLRKPLHNICSNARQYLYYLIVIFIVTMLAAHIEVFVTPKLIQMV